MDSQMGNDGAEAGGTRREPPCKQCRQKKIKCDKKKPCQNCTRLGLSCSYNDVLSVPAGHETYDELQERVAQLEDQLRLLTSRPHASSEKPSTGSITPKPSPLECRCGRQIFGSSFSIHYDSDLFWVDLFPRVIILLQ